MWRGRVFNWGCQAGGRVCWAPRDLLISLHFNSLKNKLCRLQFFARPSCDVNLRWLLLGSFPPFAASYFKAGKWSKTVEKINSPTYRHPAYIHTAPACLDTAYSLTRKTKASDTVWCFLFFPFFFGLLEHSPVRHCNISIDFPFFSHVCVLF